MPRLSYRPNHDLGPVDLVAAIKERRRGDLLKMDRLMLHSPPFAAAWNDFLKIVIEGLSIPLIESQLVMCLIGEINSADYEVFSHARTFLGLGGTQAQLDALKEPDEASGNAVLFSERERAIIQLATAMTRDVAISDECFDGARAVVRDDAEMIELVGLISTYNMVSRFVVALDVHAYDGYL